MRAASYLVAFLGALFLLAAAAAWWKIARDPQEEEDAAARVGIGSRRMKSAAIATAIAFGLSGVAAMLAVVDWFIR